MKKILIAAILLIVVLVLVFLVLPFKVLKSIAPRPGMECSTLSDCPKEFPGLDPVDCKEHEGEKVCWYGSVCSGPLACQLFDLFCVCLK